MSGKGPFTHDAGRGLFASDAMYNMTVPSDFKIPGLGGCGDPYHYAFASVEHMLRNIQSMVLLREFEFKFSVYKSYSHFVLPDGQVAFDKDKATLVESHFIHEFPFENYF